MAKRQVVSYSYTCDVCGATIPDSDGESATRKLTWEGTDYYVDVCDADGSKLGDVLTGLKEFVDAGSRASGRRGRRPSTAGATASPRAPRPAAPTSTAGTAPKRGDVGTIRAWARANGHKVNERGRIPGALMEAYDAANSVPPPAAAAPEPAAPARKRRPRKAAAAG